jgi:hypothetical protein
MNVMKLFDHLSNAVAEMDRQRRKLFFANPTPYMVERVRMFVLQGKASYRKAVKQGNPDRIAEQANWCNRLEKAEQYLDKRLKRIIK